MPTPIEPETTNIAAKGVLRDAWSRLVLYAKRIGKNVGVALSQILIESLTKDGKRKGERS